MSLRSGSAWWIVGFLVGCGGNTSGSTCETGSLRCGCYRNLTCDSGLVCMSDVCVVDPSSAGASGSAGKSATSANARGGAATGGQRSDAAAGQSIVPTGGALASSANDVGRAGGNSIWGVAGDTARNFGGSVFAAGAGDGNPGGNRSTSGALQAGSGGVANAGASNGGSPTAGARSGGATNGGTNGETIARGGTTAMTTALGSGGNLFAVCNTNTNIVADALSDTVANWYGGDPAFAEDNVCGAQGQIRAYGDKGVDNVAGTADDTCPWAINDKRPSCFDGRCCIAGKTVTWPKKPGSTALDYDASVWGCGLRVDLNSQGIGAALLPYFGQLKGLQIQLSGTVNGQAIRIGYDQAAEDQSAPFAPGKVGTNNVLFTDVTCPSWATATCVKGGNNPYGVAIQIVGGDVGGDFNLCIDSIKPIF